MYRSVTLFKNLQSFRYIRPNCKQVTIKHTFATTAYICINNETPHKLSVTITENEHAHNVLLDLPVYSTTTVNVKKLVSFGRYSIGDAENNKDIPLQNQISANNWNFNDTLYFDDILELLQNFEISDKNVQTIFQEITNFVSKNVMILSDDKLLELLLQCIPLAYKYTNFYKDCSHAFDILSQECIKRSSCWSANQLLLVADIWYAHQAVSYQFHSHVVQLLFDKRKNLKSHQIVQTFFYVNLIRRFHFDIQEIDVKRKIINSMEDIGVEELGIIAVGLFKSKSIVSDIDILKSFVNILIKNKENVSDISLGGILKFLRYNLTLIHEDHIKLCSAILSEFKSEVNTRGHFALILLSSLGNGINLYSEELLEKCVSKLITEFPTMRLKDLERLCFVILNSSFESVDPINLMKLFEAELLSPKRRKEIEIHVESYLSLIFYLACLGHYNSFLISDALKLNDQPINQYSPMPKWMREKIKKRRLRQLCVLDMMLDIEGPNDYDGHRLNEMCAQSLRRKYLPRIPSADLSHLTVQEQAFNRLTDLLNLIIGDNYFTSTFILPSSPLPELIFCTDQELRLIPVPQESLKACAPEDVKFIPDHQRHLKWNVIIHACRKALLHDSDKLKGIAQTRVRLLEKLGYNVIIIYRKHFLSYIPDETAAQNILSSIENYISSEDLARSKSNLNIDEL